MRREQMLIAFCLGFGGIGWLMLAVSTPFALVSGVWAFAVIALAVDLLSFRLPPADSHSLVGLVLVAAALALGAPNAMLLAGVEGVLSGVALMLLYRSPRNFYHLAARPILRSGSRMLGLAFGASLAPSHALGEALVLALGYFAVTQFGRVAREYLQGGRSGIATWWHSAWRMALGVELAPLPLAVVGAEIYTTLGAPLLLLAGTGLVATAAVVRRSALNLQRQGRSVRELALLNEVSRAIIRSELRVDALCDLIYRETSKIVDTATFSLGLFEGTRYHLLVRVQDRVRLPRLVAERGDDGLTGWMRRTGRALLVEDFQHEMDRLPARPTYQSERPPRSGIYVPLIAGDEVIGSISVQSPQPAAFDANDLRILSLIADQAAVAIARARIFNQAQERALQLQAVREVSERITAILNLEELLPSVVRLIRERFGYHPVHIFTLDRASDQITFRASTALTEQVAHMRATPLRLGLGLVGTAAAEGRTILVGDVGRDPRYIRDSAATSSELAVPLRIGETVIGVLDVQSDQRDDFDDSDRFVIQTLADQIAIAIDSANSYAAQQEEAWTLNALLQIAEHAGRSEGLVDLIPTIVRLPPLLIGGDRCHLLLYQRAEDQYQFADSYGLRAEQRAQLIGRVFAAADAPLLDHLRLSTASPEAPSRPIDVIDGLRQIAAFPSLIAECRSGTLVVLPLLTRGMLLGVVLIDYDQPGIVLNARQIALCQGAAAQLAGALESALLAREAAEAAQFEQELRVARDIQTALLPQDLPKAQGWQVAADWRSARLVGGDFYDFWWLGQQRTVLGFTIADVSDKGVPAAMFMALARSLVRAAALDGSPPASAMERANRWITRDSESGMFVTLFYGLLDTETAALRYTCAGHNPPLLYRAQTRRCDRLATPGIAMGVLEEITLHEAETSMAVGDMLVCYTDGVTEAINHLSEEFGVERLTNLIEAHHGADAQTMVDAIVAAVAHHASGRPPFDDLTLVVICRTAH